MQRLQHQQVNGLGQRLATVLRAAIAAATAARAMCARRRAVGRCGVAAAAVAGRVAVAGRQAGRHLLLAQTHAHAACRRQRRRRRRMWVQNEVCVAVSERKDVTEAVVGWSRRFECGSLVVCWAMRSRGRRRMLVCVFTADAGADRDRAKQKSRDIGRYV